MLWNDKRDAREFILLKHIVWILSKVTISYSLNVRESNHFFTVFRMSVKFILSDKIETVTEKKWILKTFLNNY